jgi:hypothetical protein
MVHAIVRRVNKWVDTMENTGWVVEARRQYRVRSPHPHKMQVWACGVGPHPHKVQVWASGVGPHSHKMQVWARVVGPHPHKMQVWAFCGFRIIAISVNVYTNGECGYRIVRVTEQGI